VACGIIAIRHQQQTGAGELLEEQPGDMGGAADADSAQRCLVGILFQPGNQFGQVARRRCVLGEDHLRGGGDERYRLEIVQQVIGQRVDGAVDHIGAPVAKTDGGAVGRRASDPADADDAVPPARHVLDDDALTKRDLHALGDDARNRVDRSAGRKRHDHRDRTRWKVLRGRAPGACQSRRQRDRQKQPSHSVPP
jgi:hypothetical protein